MVGISVYTYLYHKLAKMICLIVSCFLFNKVRGEEGGTGSVWKYEEEVAQTLYTHENKCKNDKIKERKRNKMHNIYQRKGNQFPKVLVVNF
jgi:hypothetical protein